MAEYTIASLVVLLVAGAIAWRSGLLARRSTWLGLAVFGGVTVLADVVLTGLPIVTYAAGRRSGLSIGPMPIEDLLYGLALFLVAAIAWDGAGRTEAAGRPAGPGGEGRPDRAAWRAGAAGAGGGRPPMAGGA